MIDTSVYSFVIPDSGTLVPACDEPSPSTPECKQKVKRTRKSKKRLDLSPEGSVSSKKSSLLNGVDNQMLDYSPEKMRSCLSGEDDFIPDFSQLSTPQMQSSRCSDSENDDNIDDFSSIDFFRNTVAELKKQCHRTVRSSSSSSSGKLSKLFTESDESTNPDMNLITDLRSLVTSKYMNVSYLIYYNLQMSYETFQIYLVFTS